MHVGVVSVRVERVPPWKQPVGKKMDGKQYSL